MITTDPIADLLTRIRNAYSAGKDSVLIPHSNTKVSILENLKKRNFISSFQVAEDQSKRNIEVQLNPEIRSITLKRISKPGQRIYVKSAEIKKVRGGLGLAILSTPKGIISGEEAKKLNLGGELICEVY